jgi:glyoxylase-like metal-dependent hydrolase (beta-lactamase superfamily II)
LQTPLPLPELAARTAVDVAKGYAVSKIVGDVYFVTDGSYNTMFAVADAGVVYFDCPPSLGNKTIAAVKEITDKPVTHFVYSHAHKDHVGGAIDVFGSEIEYVGSEQLTKRLTAVADSKLPVPTTVVKSGESVTIGGVQIKLTELPYSHDVTTTLVEIPAADVAMIVDIFYPGWVPFRCVDALTSLFVHMLCGFQVAVSCSS